VGHPGDGGKDRGGHEPRQAVHAVYDVCSVSEAAHGEQGEAEGEELVLK